MTSYMMTQISWVPGWYASAMTSLFSLRHGISPLTFFHKICWVTYKYPFPICTPQIIQNENILLCKNTHSIQLTCRTIVQQKVWTGCRLEYHSTTWCKIQYTIIGIMTTVIKWKHFRVTGRVTKASDAELWCVLWSAPEQTVEQTIETPLIWDAISLIMTSL